MQKFTRHASWLALTLILSLSLVGCYRSIGGSLEPTRVSDVALASLNASSGTNLAATVPVPTAEQVTPFPTAMPQQINTPVDGQGGQAAPSATATAVMIAMAATNTPSPTNTVWPTPRPLPTQTPIPSPTTLYYAPPPSYTPFYTNPIPLVEAQPLGERPTATLVPAWQISATPYVVAQVPTWTPLPSTPVPGVIMPTPNAQQIEATQIVFIATMTAAAIQGITLPTTTLIPGQVQPVQPVYPGVYPPNATVITATPFGRPGICNEHLVLINETLYRIARNYGITLDHLVNANGITNPDIVEAGSTLLIPCVVPPTPTPQVAPVVQGIDGQGGYNATSPASGPRIYVVQAGDNIYQISRKFGVDMAELVAANGLNTTTMNMIVEGQQLIIPASATNPPGPTLVPAVGPASPTPFIIIITSVPTPGYPG